MKKTKKVIATLCLIILAISFFIYFFHSVAKKNSEKSYNCKIEIKNYEKKVTFLRRKLDVNSKIWEKKLQ